VDEVLRRPEVAALASEVSSGLLASWVREALDAARGRVLADQADAGSLTRDLEALPGVLRERSARLRRSPLRRVINATGVLVHTNLGRAPLGDGALDAMREAGASYNNLEYDLDRGERGSRTVHLKEVASALFPGRSLLAVNNNAAAVLLVLNTLAEGKEVVISRGELVEIGGSFRIPEVMAKAGAVLREVGTTNRTRISDYRGALSERTGLLVKVHTSNYRVVGFVEDTPLDQLVPLGAERAIPVVVDEGSGNLLPAGERALQGEPHVMELLEAGANLVTFSGDKLLGGPQAGLIVGDGDLVARCARNPLARALRIEKTRIAALAATLAEHAAGRARETVPILEMFFRQPEELERRAREIASLLASKRSPVEASIEKGASQVGGGAAPLHDLPTRLLSVRPKAKSPSAYEAALRQNDPPVIARIADEKVLVDLRTVDPSEDTLLASALDAAAR
jgi:L-seryl-tRNA(Ser) seleniumtransferase